MAFCLSEGESRKKRAQIHLNKLERLLAFISPTSLSASCLLKIKEKQRPSGVFATGNFLDGDLENPGIPLVTQKSGLLFALGFCHFSAIITTVNSAHLWSGQMKQWGSQYEERKYCSCSVDQDILKGELSTFRFKFLGLPVPS